MFDVPPPLQSRRLDEYEKAWDLFIKYHKLSQAFDGMWPLPSPSPSPSCDVAPPKLKTKVASPLLSMTDFRDGPGVVDANAAGGLMVSIGSTIAASLLMAAPAAIAVRKELAPTGALRAAINFNNPLLARRDVASGELSGLVVDLSRELTQRIGVPLELIPCEAAGKIAGSATDNVWDIGYLAIDPLRAKDIDFTAAYVEIEGTYLVPVGSPLQRIEDMDRDGVRIAVTAGSAYDLFLSRELKYAQIVRADNTPKSFELMAGQKLDAVAAVRTALVTAAKRLPGSRVLSGHFMTIPQAAGVPRGRPAAARYVSEFIEEMKASGFVASALKKYGLGPDDAIVTQPASIAQ